MPVRRAHMSDACSDNSLLQEMKKRAPPPPLQFQLSAGTACLCTERVKAWITQSRPCLPVVSGGWIL